ncbi:EmrB/QacA subfamily drug resistance transporter [Stackebrandtia albiflava]|uniref:EmrB/QacA subfamily drug resistance transporter n=1 Tax=Stackebrandtia albiflava TaxID=406432 RepID=A0A562V2H6_9ACTN|nr:MFS transporter [Stackebrandtia albiflava]TWJ12055.1 EmrB/QacA subfamily drug resistance transporter [Stackebrandtia albiflava]
MAADSGIRLDSTTGRGIVVAAVLGSSVALLDGTVVNVALPHIGEEFGSELDGLQWVVNGYTLMLAAVVLLGGALGDRFGRRRVFLIGVVWFGVASLLCGLAPGIVSLVVARLLQGIGAGLLTPGSLAIIQASLRREDRAKAIGAWSGLGGVAAAAGPFLGGWLVDAVDWRLVFLINLPLVAATVWAAVRWVPESRDTTRDGGFDLAGATLGAVFLGGLTFALVQPGMLGWVAAVVAVVAAVGFVVVERRAAAPVVPGEMFADRQFTAINAVTFFVYAGLGGVMFFVVMQLQVVSDYSALAAGLTMLPFTVLMLAFSARAGALGERIGPRWPLTVGPLLAGVGVFMLIGVGADAPYWTAVLPGVLVMSVGMTVTVAPLTAGVLAATDVAHAGVASGINNAIARAAGLLAVAALPLAAGLNGEAYRDPFAFALGYQIAIALCAVLFVVGALIGVVFVRDPKWAAHRAARTQCPYNAPQLDPGVAGAERDAS